MNWSRAMCLIGSHELTKWRKLAGRDAIQEQHCKRVGCKFLRHKPLKPRRRKKAAEGQTPWVQEDAE